MGIIFTVLQQTQYRAASGVTASPALSGEPGGTETEVDTNLLGILYPARKEAIELTTEK